MPPRTLSRLIARLTLVWFALALGVAAASPLVQPRAMQLVCGAQGGVKLLVDRGEGLVEAGHDHQLDCALCLLTAAPPPAMGMTAALAPPPALHVPLLRLDAPAPRMALAPLPARGPPHRS